MNILFVSSGDPRYYKSGGEQRTHLIWESLTRHGRVFSLVYDWNSTTEGDLIEGEHPLFKFRPEFKKKNIGYKANCLPKYLTGVSLNIGRYIVFPNPIIVFNCAHFDLVVSRYISPLYLYEFWDLAPVIIDIDDYPMQVFETINSPQLHFPLRQIGRYLIKWKTNFVFKKARGGWLSNKEQIGLCGSNYHYLPNIPNRPSDNYLENHEDRKNLFTVGLMDYAPNLEGINRFLSEIWPSFHTKHPEVKYYIVGRNAPEEDITIWNNTEGVEYLGFVENLELLYQGILATVVPIYSGGGTCIKTLESMAFSRTCLSSEFGARGLPEHVITDKKGVIVYESADDFIGAYE